MRKSFLVLLSGLAVLAAGVGPVAADTAISHSWSGELGRVPRHRLIDTFEKAGMTVHYIQTGFGTEDAPGRAWWTLDKISVRPPKMWGARDNHRVAWRFIVERGKVGTGVGVPPDWKVTYRSPRQWSRAHVSSPAQFSRMSVPVVVPGDHSGGDSWAYRVKVKMFWYRRDGRVQATALHAIDWYKLPADAYSFVAPVVTSQSPY